MLVPHKTHKNSDPRYKSNKACLKKKSSEKNNFFFSHIKFTNNHFSYEKKSEQGRKLNKMKCPTDSRGQI